MDIKRLIHCMFPLLVLVLLASLADAQDDMIGAHGLAMTGAPKYPADFSHFDYANPEAPKGGRIHLGAVGGTFDSLNPFIIKGVPAAGIGLIYDTLMVSSMDEVSTEYGLLADAVKFPADYSSVTYRLREGAKWHHPEFQELAPYVLGHRIWLGPHAASHGLTTEAVIDDVVARVPIP